MYFEVWITTTFVILSILIVLHNFWATHCRRNIIFVLINCYIYNITLLPQGRTGAVTRTSSSPKLVASQNFSGPRGHNSTIISDRKKVMTRKPAQDNGDNGKLVEMIESQILDRIPSDKWEDIG